MGRIEPKQVDLTGKVAIVTGGNNACRNTESGKELVELAQTLPVGKIEVMKLDLCSFSSIRSFVISFKTRNLPLNILVNNAGLVTNTRSTTEDGLEVTTGVAHYGHFLLTLSLLDVLKATPSSRVVMVASGSHYTGSIDLTDPRYHKKWSTMKAYGDAKLLNVFFAVELQRRLGAEGANVTINALHPGTVATTIWGGGGCLGKLFKCCVGCCMLSPEEGAWTTVYCATSPELNGVGGKYFDNCKAKMPAHDVLDTDLSRKIWSLSEEVTGIKYPAL